MSKVYSNGKGKSGLRGIPPRMRRSFRVSLVGLIAAYRNEDGFRLLVLLLLILFPLGLWLGADGVQKALLVGSLVLVLIVELLNSAVEAVVDRIGTEYHDISKLAKDLGSAATFLALFNAGVIWILVLWG